MGHAKQKAWFLSTLNFPAGQSLHCKAFPSFMFNTDVSPACGRLANRDAYRPAGQIKLNPFGAVSNCGVMKCVSDSTDNVSQAKLRKADDITLPRAPYPSRRLTISEYRIRKEAR